MKKAYHFAAIIFIACAAACNNAPTTTTSSSTTTATTTETPKDNTPPANQPEGLTLISQSDCPTCHNATAKIVGPSYTAIADKYPNTPENISKLADQIIKGGSGTWGSVPMTPHPNLQKADAEKMTTYILSLHQTK